MDGIIVADQAAAKTVQFVGQIEFDRASRKVYQYGQPLLVKRTGVDKNVRC
jgi:hypothetical protein